MTTSLDILVRAQDQATGTLNKVSSAGKKLDTTLTGAGKKTSALGGFFDSTAGKLTSMVGGAVIAQKAFSFLTDSVAAAEESKAAVDGLRTSLNSMGRDLSADIFTKQASDLQFLTGITDEEIIAAQGLLATFGNISDELLVKLTPAVTDFAARFTHGDMTSAATLLGKALNDPIKGVTSLTRVGVSLTDQQKKEVAALVKSGDLMGAQKVILDELSRETKDFAKNTATASQKMQVAWGELEEFLGKKLLPTFGNVAEGITGILQAVSSGDAAGGAAAVGHSLLDMLAPVERFLPVFGGAADEIDNFRDALSLGDRAKAYNAGLEKIQATLTDGSTTRAEAIQQLDDLRQLTGIDLPKASSEYIDALIHEKNLVTTSTGTIADNTTARELNRKEIRAQQQAMLASIDANFAVADAVQGVQVAERKLSGLRAKGITDGAKYEAATRGLADANLSLEGALIAQEEANKGAGLSAQDSRQKTIEWGKSIGLTRQEVIDILPPLKGYNHELDSIPSNVHTTITYDIRTHGKPPDPRGNPNTHPPGGSHDGGSHGGGGSNGRVVASTGRTRIDVRIDRRRWVDESDYETSYRGF